MEHTLENALKAKKFLIEDGFSEDDFTDAIQDDVEIGYLIGEPLLIDEDGFAKSSIELWTEKLFLEKNADAYIDYMNENVL